MPKRLVNTLFGRSDSDALGSAVGAAGRLVAKGGLRVGDSTLFITTSAPSTSSRVKESAVTNPTSFNSATSIIQPPTDEGSGAGPFNR